MRALTVLLAPDSFKGSLTSVQVARALEAGWHRARPDDDVLIAPLADGGEGTLVAIEAAGGWLREITEVTDPIGRRIRASWLRSADGQRAFIEMAQASGLSRLTPDERAPMTASTVGTGELVRAALDAGVSHVTLGIGGSATSDGGRGMLEALGLRVAGGGVDPGGLDRRLRGVDVRVACDVTNPLLGPLGAAATYGPQKGATPTQVVELDQRLAAWADALEAATGTRARDLPGAGAAGGMGFALLALRDCFRSLELVPGVDIVMDAADIDGKLGRADLVLTGEGRVDEQTAFGKTALGVARRAHERGLPVIAIGGGVTTDGIAALAPLGVVAVPVVERPQSIEEAMTGGAGPLERCGERIARLVGLVS